MSDKQFLLELAPMEHTLDHRRAKSSLKLSICRVCGDQAKIINYGALSCQPCKTFFRRNGLHPECLPPCIHSGTCDISKTTRRFCSSCRLTKCFSKGMSSDFIRKEEPKSTKDSSTSKYKRNVQTLYKLREASDLSQSERYLLFGYQKTIISSVVRALEVYSAIPKVREIIEDELALIFDLPFDASSATQCINHIFTSIQSFINSIPDFRIMDITEQSSLFQRNFDIVAFLYSALVFHQTGIMHRPDFIQSFTSIYGSEIMMELVKISKQLSVDLITMKIMLLILAFSANCSIVNYEAQINGDILLTSTFHLFVSQNEYATILWKHMVCQYGYYKAACYFNQLIGFSLKLTKSSGSTYMRNETYHQLVNTFHWNNGRFFVNNQHEQARL